MEIRDVLVPDIGNTADVDVIEVMVSPGDIINKEDSLITLEGDKATMEIPAPFGGVIKELKINVGDKISEGILILTMEVDGSAEEAPATKKPKEEKSAKPAQPPPPKPSEPAVAPVTEQMVGDGHASPGVRRLARDLDIDLTKVKGTGRKGRVLKEDVQRFYDQLVLTRHGGGGLFVAPAPVIDFSRYGEIESKALNKIKKATGANLHRNWVTIPHVTQFGEADITEMEAFRQAHKDTPELEGAKLTPLVFLIKAVVASLKLLPQFNASLDSRGENLIFKKYYNVGVAVDTPNGLVVPVIKDVDKKGLIDLAKELAAISIKARDKGLTMAEMEGSCFSISSLGGIGGTAFTPIVNAPDVAILGVSKSSMKPVYDGDAFKPRLMLPLSLSYDHRVIDGADAARFIVSLANHLEDIRQLTL